MIVISNTDDIVIPATSYANAGGQGNRGPTGSNLITVTATAVINFGTFDNLVDGDFTRNATGSIAPVGIATTGQYIRFDFGAGVKKYIDEVRFNDASYSPDNGSWKWQGSNDASSWTDLGTFTWNNGVLLTTLTGLDVAGYRYYQMILTADHLQTNDWFAEVEFKIAPGAA
jgi:hypothetical protein